MRVGLQFHTDDTDTTLKSQTTKGDPGHSQSWGQPPKEVRAYLTSIGLNPGIACNPTRSSGGARIGQSTDVPPEHPTRAAPDSRSTRHRASID